MAEDLWHHLSLTGPQPKGLLTGSKKAFNGPTTSVSQHKGSIRERQGIGEEILGAARLSMLVVLDQGELSRSVSRILHRELAHIRLEVGIIMAFKLAKPGNAMLGVGLEDVGVVA
jgi:hypothetical protein